MPRRKWKEVHRELTTVNVKSFFGGYGNMEVWLCVNVKQRRDGTYKGFVVAKSITDETNLQTYPILYIRTKHPDSELVKKLNEYGIKS